MIRFLAFLLLALLPPLSCLRAAETPAGIVVDARTGSVLWQSSATEPRYPASVTKLMTVYVALQAIQANEVTPQTPVLVSAHAAAQGGSRLGLRTGDRIPLWTALQAVIVRSANDAAVAVAETIAVSELAFAARMTQTARQLGMTATGYRNASGMTAAGHQTTARDMAILALALRRDFPHSWDLFASRSVHWQRGRAETLNGFLLSVPGAEGMKTGFTCSAGYNLVASTQRHDRRIITVILGASTKSHRASLASQWTERGFDSPASGPSVNSLDNLAGPAPDLSGQVCGYSPGLRSTPPVIPGETTARPLPRTPKGWAVELAFGREEEKVQRWIIALHRQFAKDLGGGMPLVTVKPFHGDLRYRGLVVGLEKERAISTCLALRVTDEERCLVLTPEMVQGAIDEEWRLRMSMAQ